jgi:lipopolysaccharide export LptBFGC system permease protein LptF
MVSGWSLLTFLAIGGLVSLAGLVESGWQPLSGGLEQALLAGLLQVPEVWVRLAPLCCCLGAALAAARCTSTGERLALEASGWSLARLAWSAGAVGLFVGLLQWSAAGHLLHRVELLRAAAPAEWIWVEGGAVRLVDDLRVELDEGQVQSVRSLEASELPREQRWQARMIQRPGTASHAALSQSSLVPVRVERHGRQGRIVACVLFSMLGWMPLSTRSGRQLLVAACLGFVLQVTGLWAESLGAQGHLTPWLAGWWGALTSWSLLVLLVGWARWSPELTFTRRAI